MSRGGRSSGLVVLLHSPAEPRNVVTALKRAAAADNTDSIEVLSSPLCEQRGVDFLWWSHGRAFGVQRKELHDFFASLDDGRLAREIPQMVAHITMPVLVLEGPIRTTNEGTIITRGYRRPVTASSLTKHVLSVALRGVTVLQSANVAETCRLVVDTYQWSQADSHSTAAARPKPTGDWGKPSSRDWQLHLITSLPGVGPELAAAILDTLGRCPVVVDATEGELQTVPGIGKTKARRILAALDRKREPR